MHRGIQTLNKKGGAKRLRPLPLALGYVSPAPAAP